MTVLRSLGFNLVFFSYHLLLAFAKPLFAFNIKYPGNISTGARLDLRIGISKLQFQVISKVLANSRFAGPHGAD